MARLREAGLPGVERGGNRSPTEKSEILINKHDEVRQAKTGASCGWMHLVGTGIARSGWASGDFVVVVVVVNVVDQKLSEAPPGARSGAASIPTSTPLGYTRPATDDQERR